MKVKRNSWHYKISNWGRDKCEIDYTNDNLCAYFWRLVGKVLLTLFFIHIIIMLLYLFAISGVIIESMIIVLWILSTIFIPPIAIFFIRKKLGKSPESPESPEIPGIPGSNILISYIKAKKEKVCPFIEYVG